MKPRAAFEINVALGFVMFQKPGGQWKSPNYCIQYDINPSIAEALDESESFNEAAVAFAKEMRAWSPLDTKVELERLFTERHNAECKKNSLGEK